jgi:hypothetical protein
MPVSDIDDDVRRLGSKRLAGGSPFTGPVLVISQSDRGETTLHASLDPAQIVLGHLLWDRPHLYPLPKRLAVRVPHRRTKGVGIMSEHHTRVFRIIRILPLEVLVSTLAQIENVQDGSESDLGSALMTGFKDFPPYCELSVLEIMVERLGVLGLWSVP